MQDGNISCHVDNLKRQRPDKSLRSAIETAAYNARTKLWSAQNEAFADVSHKGDIAFEAVIAPEGAPDWAHDRSEVWNRIDTHAPRKDTRLAKTIMGSIARQIPHADRIAMVRELVAPWVAEGVIADVAIHDDGSNHNPHVHVMLTTRLIRDDTFGGKIESVEQRRFVTGTRQRWAELNNAYLKKNGSSLRLDHRSYKARGIGTEPTRHRGPQNKRKREDAPVLQQSARLPPERAKPEPVQQPEPARPLVASTAPKPEATMREPTDAERRDYPLLAEREQWPPPVEPAPDMNRAERSELRRYWDEHQIERIEGEQLRETGEPERQYPEAITPLSAPERVEEPVEARVHSSAQYALDLALEADLDRAIAERSARLRQDAIDMHRGLLGYTQKERELLKIARDAPPEEARVIRDYLIFKRMEHLQAKENERLKRDMAKYLAPERIQAMKDRIEADSQLALRQAQARQEASREAAPAEPPRGMPEAERTEIVQGPNSEPLHPRERDLAEERLLDDMLREVEALPEPHLGDHIDHAHAARKMLRDFERDLEEPEQERER